MQGSAYRLPRTVTPSRYDLQLRLDPAATTFSGVVVVALTVHEAVGEIVLNAKALTVERAEITGPDGMKSGTVAGLATDDVSERLTLTLDAALSPGDHTLRLDFSGSFGEHLAGLYRSRYRDAAGEEQYLIATHFEATDARRAFPCWDEPDLKASFNVTVDAPDGLVVLTNTPEIGREPGDDGSTRVRFAGSMRMSSYLVAIAVGDFGLTAAADARGIPVRTVCRPDRLALAAYANTVGVFTLDWFTDYYGIPYPEQKLDQIALPDFAAGAMENTGLVTYRETLLLVDPVTAAPNERLNVAETIAHENAHMWFGDLVTMRWWNGLWLNEAFATFMSYLCVDAMEPAWRVFDAFQADRMRAFEVDSLATTRPIEFPVESPADATGMFDVLTYTKGGAVLRMIEQWLGREVFRDGIRRYLIDHAHGNTETHDLWDALEAESGRPVRRIMEPWIFQPGYPAITVSLDGDVIRLTQHRFAPTLPDDTTTWPVPLIVRQVFPDGELVEHVLVEADGLELALAHPDALVVANAGSTAFVRTFYDEALRGRLLTRVTSDLTPGERQSLVDDAWAAVVAGDAGVSSFLDLVAGFTQETSPPVWQTILVGLRWCDRFVGDDARERFQESVRELIRPALQRLGWEGRDDESDLDRELRGDLIRAMGTLGDDRETQALAREDEARARAGHEHRSSGRLGGDRCRRLRRRALGVRGLHRAHGWGSDAA